MYQNQEIREVLILTNFNPQDTTILAIITKLYRNKFLMHKFLSSCFDIAGTLLGAIDWQSSQNLVNKFFFAFIVNASSVNMFWGKTLRITFSSLLLDQTSDSF